MKNSQLKDNYLDKIPYRSEIIEWKQDDKKKVILLIENKGLFNKIAQICFNRPKISQIHLDEMGSYIWPLLDGKNTVYDVALCIKEKFGNKAEPLYERLIKYLNILENQGFIEIE